MPAEPDTPVCRNRNGIHVVGTSCTRLLDESGQETNMDAKALMANLPGVYARARKETEMVRWLQHWSGHETEDIDSLMTLLLMSAMPTIQHCTTKRERHELAVELADNMKNFCGEDPAGWLGRAVGVLLQDLKRH